RKLPWSWRQQESVGCQFSPGYRGPGCGVADGFRRVTPRGPGGVPQLGQLAGQRREAGDGGFVQERVELALLVELRDVAEAAQRLPVDEDLGHRPLAGGGHQPAAQVVAAVDVDLGELGALLAEELLGRGAVRAPGRDVDPDLG